MAEEVEVEADLVVVMEVEGEKSGLWMIFEVQSARAVDDG